MRNAATDSNKLPSKGQATQASDAITLLIDDHEHVKSLFAQYATLGERAHATKKKIAIQICQQLLKHTIAEEEIFYPAVRSAAKKNEDMVDEATVEHGALRDLIKHILAMEPTEQLYDANVKVLQELVEHHVQEEEDEMFPKAKQAKLDMESLGRDIAGRKAEIAL